MVKTKKLLSAVLTAILICIASGMAVTASAECTEHTYDNGFCTNEGCAAYEPATVNSQNGIYEISNAGQLYSFAQLVNSGTANTSDAILKADITVNTNVLSASGTLNSGDYKQWTPIGDSTNKYSGTFDGQGHTISGLYCNVDLEYVGLFGYLDSNGTIKNVGVADSYFYSSFNDLPYIGGMCGCNKGTINSCYVSASMLYLNNAVNGGVVGLNDNPSIKNCCYNSTFHSGTFMGNGNPYVTNVSGITTAEFASGAATWLLNGNSSEGAWGQMLTGENKDAYPTAHTDSNTVCYNASKNKYVNKCADDKHTNLEKTNGICPDCGNAYQSVTWNEVTNQYEISNAGQLYSFAQLVNSGTANTSDAILKADITVNTNVLSASGTLNSGNYKQWTPIGDSTNKYSGTFDGQGHTISGLYCNVDLEYVGLFGYLDSNGTIKNVGIIDTYFKSNYKNGSYVGGVCGYSVGIIESCYTAVTLERFSGPSCSAIAYISGGTLRNNCNNSDFCNNIYYGGGPIIKNNSGKTTAEFASGAATWLLNGNSSEGVWKQTLTGENKDTYPTFEGKTVYQQASGNTYANSLITTATNTADAPSFNASTTMYDKDGKTATDFVYDANADVTTVYVKIDGAEDGVKPIIKITGGNDTVESQTWTAVNNIYYAQFIGNFADFGTIEVTYEGADSVTIPTTTSTEEEL